MTTNIFQALQEHETNTPAEHEIDYVSWAKDKFKTPEGELDLTALARGKWESDMKFVPKILDENKEMRREIETRVSLQDFMDKWETARSAPANSSTPTGVGENNAHSQSSPNTNTLTQADIARLVEEQLTSKQREQIAKANVAQVTSALVEKWGSGYVDKLRTRAKAIGVDDNFLASVAEKSPKAFLELVLGNAPASPASPIGQYTPPRSTYAPAPALNTGPHKTKRQWDELRRKDTKEYWKVATQQQIIKDADALGDAFNA